MDAYAEYLTEPLEWRMWEEVIASNGITVDRPQGARHPNHSEIIYPMDYGYINGTTSSDGHEIDVFCGSAATSSAKQPDGGGSVAPARHTLQGAILTTDHRKGDREIKFLYRCTPRDIYLVNGFINFDRRLMEGVLILRQPMHELWNGR